jgi:hypothetical protein
MRWVSYEWRMMATAGTRVAGTWTARHQAEKKASARRSRPGALCPEYGASRSGFNPGRVPSCMLARRRLACVRVDHGLAASAGSS